MPFSALEPGSFLLKCRAKRPESGTPTLHLRLGVTMVTGSRMLLLVRALPSKPQMPFRVTNFSRMLLAFRQTGCEHWDLLGAGEVHSNHPRPLP